MSCPLLAYYKMKPYLDKIDEYMKENYNISNRSGYDAGKTYRVYVGVNWEKSSYNPDNLNHINHFYQSKKKVYIYRRSFQTPPILVKTVKDESSTGNQGVIK